VHAPDWEEIQGRAGAAGDSTAPGTAGPTGPSAGSADPGKPAGGPGDAGPGGSPGAAGPEGSAWYRTALPWAASLIIAFGLGWLASDPGRGSLRGAGEALFGSGVEAAREGDAEPARDPGVDSREELVASSGIDELQQRAGQVPAGREGPAAGQEEGAELAGETFERGLAAEAEATSDTVASVDTAPEGARPSEAAAEVAAPPVEEEPEAAAPEEADEMARQARTATTTAEKSQREAVAAGEAARRGAVAGPTTPAMEPAPARRRETESLAGRAPVPGEAAAYRADADATGSGWLAIQPSEADAWLGRPALRLPDLELSRVEVSSGTSLGPPFSPGPVIRLLYTDATAHPILLLQQQVAPDAGPDPAVRDTAPGEPTLTVTPAGLRSLRWRQDGLLLVLTASLDADALQSLADRLR